MKIKKTFQGVIPENKILNTESTSQTDTYSCDYINEKSKEIYSTEEQVIGTWIDGKPIYRKVIKVTDTLKTEMSINHEISNFDKLINYKGFITFYNSEHGIPIIYPSDMANFGVGVYSVNATRIIVEIGTKIISDGSPSNLVIILEYTKTTD